MHVQMITRLNVAPSRRQHVNASGSADMLGDEPQVGEHSAVHDY